MPDDRPPFVEEMMRELTRDLPRGSLEEVRRALESRLTDYNAAPQSDLAGLSPDQMGQLIRGDWHTTGALRLNDKLSLASLAPSIALADARTLLTFIDVNGPVKETAAGFLPLSVIASLLPNLREESARLDLTPRAPSGRVKELDLRWLPFLRGVLHYARLLARRRGLRVTTLGRELAEPERAGQLQAMLFRLWFKELDMSAYEGDESHPGLQRTIACSLYKLRSCARHLASPKQLSECAWLEMAKDPPKERDFKFGDLRYFAFWSRVLLPLEYFGLLERRERHSRSGADEVLEYRKTALFDDFLRFEFVEGRPPRGVVIEG